MNFYAVFFFLISLFAGRGEELVLRDPKFVVVTNVSAPIRFCVTNEQTGEVTCATDDQRIWVSTNFQFAFTAQSANAYVIQQTDDLVQWTDAASLSNRCGEVVTNFPVTSKRFFRVKQQ